jgi:hypothetical protein
MIPDQKPNHGLVFLSRKMLASNVSFGSHLRMSAGDGERSALLSKAAIHFARSRRRSSSAGRDIVPAEAEPRQA